MTSRRKVKSLEVLNVTSMTSRRKDGHPYLYDRSPEAGPRPLHIQDCSHWWLPGVPDSWNELLYVLFLKRGLLPLQIQGNLLEFTELDENSATGCGSSVLNAVLFVLLLFSLAVWLQYQPVFWFVWCNSSYQLICNVNRNFTSQALFFYKGNNKSKSYFYMPNRNFTSQGLTFFEGNNKSKSSIYTPKIGHWILPKKKK